ncbi:hypothetical protein [Streptomyces sp. NPDC093568]|uniref:hypothetical protein n=1 Tax=Streptomyces sp. NPDC093568 TaxID=3366041 RepID=UPI0038174FAD
MRAACRPFEGEAGTGTRAAGPCEDGRGTAAHGDAAGTPRTGVALVAAGAAFLAVLAPTPSGAVAAPSAEPRPVAPARFVPGPCPATPEPIPGRCGFLEVPENRARRGGPTVRLTVAIIRAESARPAAEPVVFMTGGPGGGAIGDIPFLIDSGLNRNRDLIVMAQRGTLHARPDLACPEIDRFYADAVGLRYDAPSTGRLLVRDQGVPTASPGSRPAESS